MPPSSRSPKILRPRYGIAEWYGKDICKMSPAERQNCGLLAIKQDATEGAINAPICPFLSTLIPNARCNKAGGVCSIRKYAFGTEATGVPIDGDEVVTVCPLRFLQPIEDGKSLFAWISDKMLGLLNPIIVKETPFLRKISDTQRPAETREMMEEEEEKKAGRIDWITVAPDSLNATELDWCAVETQALYFSGSKMSLEFEAYASGLNPVLFPKGKRRPDYRSSGPKRLAPQLDVKVPVLRNWGKKIAVVIDRYFFRNMNNLVDDYPRARDDQERRDNSDIVWFVVTYDNDLRLRADKVIFASLESSHRALNATEPLSKIQFTAVLKNVIEDPRRSNKVFKVSE